MALDPVLYRTALLDPSTGKMSREWIRFFDQLATSANQVTASVNQVATSVNQLTTKLNTFDSAWSSWTPTITVTNGTAITVLTFHDAQYVRQGPLVAFKLYFSLSLGGSTSDWIYATLPLPVIGGLSSVQVTVNPVPGNPAPGWGYCDSSGSVVRVSRGGGLYFPAGNNDILIEANYRIA